MQAFPPTQVQQVSEIQYIWVLWHWQRQQYCITPALFHEKRPIGPFQLNHCCSWQLSALFPSKQNKFQSNSFIYKALPNGVLRDSTSTIIQPYLKAQTREKEVSMMLQVLLIVSGVGLEQVLNSKHQVLFLFSFSIFP